MKEKDVFVLVLQKVKTGMSRQKKTDGKATPRRTALTKAACYGELRRVE